MGYFFVIDNKEFVHTSNARPTSIWYFSYALVEKPHFVGGGPAPNFVMFGVVVQLALLW